MGPPQLEIHILCEIGPFPSVRLDGKKTSSLLEVGHTSRFEGSMANWPYTLATPKYGIGYRHYESRRRGIYGVMGSG